MIIEWKALKRTKKMHLVKFDSRGQIIYVFCDGYNYSKSDFKSGPPSNNVTACKNCIRALITNSQDVPDEIIIQAMDQVDNSEYYRLLKQILRRRGTLKNEELIIHDGSST